MVDRDFHNWPTVTSQDRLRHAGLDGVFDDDDVTGPRVLLLLCLDTSGSMQGGPIAKVNAALRDWARTFATDAYLARTTELALVTFGNNGVVSWRSNSRQAERDGSPFVLASEFSPPTLVAGGATPMGEALRYSMDVISARKEELRRAGEQFYRPLLWLISDGEPTDGWQPLVQELADAQQRKRLMMFAVGVGAQANQRRQAVLQALSPDRHGEIDTMKFDDLLLQVSASVDAIRNGNADADGWFMRP